MLFPQEGGRYRIPAFPVPATEPKVCGVCVTPEPLQIKFFELAISSLFVTEIRLLDVVKDRNVDFPKEPTIFPRLLAFLGDSERCVCNCPGLF